MYFPKFDIIFSWIQLLLWQNSNKIPFGTLEKFLKILLSPAELFKNSDWNSENAAEFI